MTLQTRPCKKCGKQFGPNKTNRARFFSGVQLYCSRQCAYGHHKYTPERFWAMVNKTEGGCWLWTGWKLNSGYGEVSYQNRRITVHRLSYIMANGEIPKGKLVMHSCDTPLCVNPAHLSLGTDADNAIDKVSKDRHARGERSTHARLTEKDVLEIRGVLRAGGRTQKAIAEQYGVGQGAIAAISIGKTWRYLK